MKKAKKIVDELMDNPDLLQEFNKQMRSVKLKQINKNIK